MDWRIGCDLGTNSLGWCAIALDNGRPVKILAAGSRIFSDGRDPKSKASLAVDRRLARGMRRRRDRFKQRQAALLKYLSKDGLFPESAAEQAALEALDPYALRAKGLDQALTLDQLGRAIFHLNQRRGFQSNRKADRNADDDSGKIAVGIDRLCAAIADSGARTLGEFLHQRRANAVHANAIPSVRVRLRPETGEGAKGDGYDFYPGRALIKEEFDALWEAQVPHHPETLTPKVHDRLFEIVFGQRALKKPLIGKCTLLPAEERLPKAHPLFQRRRLLEELNALMVVRSGEKAERLTLEQRNLLLLKLKGKRKDSYANLRKLLKLDPDARFNKESENRSEMLGDEVAAELGAKTRFGNRWGHLSPDTQWEIISRLQEEEDETVLRQWLQDHHGLSPDQAKATAAARLPQGTGRFGRTASERLIKAMTDAVIVYSEAVVTADLGHHSDFRSGEVFLDKAGRPTLPYYGVALERHIMPGTAEPSDPEEMRIGRLTNPTVHIGLNQLRRVVNRLIKTYGPPSEIAIELARELKQTEEDKIEEKKRNNANRLAAEQRSVKLRDIGKPDTGANRTLLKLWEDLNPDNVLDRRCIYSGERIGIEMLFSDAVEVDHILPFATTLDDSNSNKIVCLREANRRKRKQSPFQAWGHTPQWEEIAARASRLPPEKRKRFEPDAMERFAEKGGFLARQLTDTQYLSRLAGEYLECLFPGKGEGSSRVWVSPGRLTEMVRRKLGLNDLLPDHNFHSGADQPKNRLDHRHHAIDAVVIAIIDRALLNEVSRVSGTKGDEGRERIIIPEPWPGFREDLRQAVGDIVVSHRPDHGSVLKSHKDKTRDQTAGRLHNDTAYGLTGQTDSRGNSIVVHRVPLDSLKPGDIETIRDTPLRDALRNFTAGRDGKEFEKRLSQFPELGPLVFRGIRHLRVCAPLTVIPIRDKTGKVYKGYKGDSNYRYDVWEMPDGKWTAEVVSMFDAHQPAWTSPIRAACPTARKVLSLHQNDLIAIAPEADERRVMRVVKFGQNGQITLAEPHESGELKKRDATDNEKDPFKYQSPTAGGLKKLKARQVRIDELGRLRDPGFPARTARRATRKPPAP